MFLQRSWSSAIGSMRAFFNFSSSDIIFLERGVFSALLFGQYRICIYDNWFELFDCIEHKREKLNN